MTEHVAEDAQVEEIKFEDDVHEMMHAKFVGLIKDRNALVGKANAANGDAMALTNQITEESTDPNIVAARNARDEAAELLDSLVTPQVEAMVSNASEGLAETEEAIKEIDGKLKPGIRFFKGVYGDDAVNALPKQTRPKGMRISNSGTSGKRIRGFNVTLTIDGEITEFESFSAAAKYLDEDTKSLQNAFFTAAGSDTLKEIPNKVSFNVSFTEADEDENETTKTAAVLAYRVDPDEDVADNNDNVVVSPVESDTEQPVEVDEDPQF